MAVENRLLEARRDYMVPESYAVRFFSSVSCEQSQSRSGLTTSLSRSPCPSQFQRLEKLNKTLKP